MNVPMSVHYYSYFLSTRVIFVPDFRVLSSISQCLQIHSWSRMNNRESECISNTNYNSRPEDLYTIDIIANSIWSLGKRCTNAPHSNEIRISHRKSARALSIGNQSNCHLYIRPIRSKDKKGKKLKEKVSYRFVCAFATGKCDFSYTRATCVFEKSFFETCAIIVLYISH